MKKTIELSEKTQRSLMEVAQQTGRSEAELIRTAIEDYLIRQQHSLDRSTTAQQALNRLREIGRRMPSVDAVELARESRENLERRGVN